MTLPTGTVTFLFADIEGGSRLMEEQPEPMHRALEYTHARMREAVQAHRGQIFKTVGDVCCAVFATASDAVAAALAAQLALSQPDGSALSSASLRRLLDAATPIKIRIALNTGPAEQRNEDYFGPPLNRVARLLATTYGGQVVMARTTAELARDLLPPDAGLRDLGEHRLRDLTRSEQIFQLTHPDLPSDFPPLLSLDSPNLPNNLPRQLTSFVGREHEIVQVKERLEATRLLTLTGAGGCGKTRLALQVAADLLDQYPDGVWVVELAGLTDPVMAPLAIAATLHLHETTGKAILQSLTEQLKHRRLLLVLDGCEHLLSACAQLADTLIRSCTDLRLLTSSREPLGILGETVYRVPSLALPDPKADASPERLAQCESAHLFLDRAHLCKPDFVLTAQNAPILAQICRRLDGIPLAIELAASRLRALSLEQIAARLDDRFRLLTGGSRTALPRHQTLRALIDWSYDLLNDLERVLLSRLSVFAGGFTLEAAEAICANGEFSPVETHRYAAAVEERGSSANLFSTFLLSLFPEDALDLLTGLLDKSLITYESGEAGERYRLLETVRQYAKERLEECGETELIRSRHAAWFLQFAEEASIRAGGPEQAEWLDRLELEHDNLRAALVWGLERQEDPSFSLRLAGTLANFWKMRGYWSEGRAYLTAALARSGAETMTQARAAALHGAGEFARSQGDTEAARVLHEESLAIYQALNDRYGVAASLNSLGLVASGHGEYERARTFWEQALEINGALGFRSDQATNLCNLGSVAYAQGEYDRSNRLYEEALRLNRRIGDPIGQAICLNSLGNVAYAQGKLERTRELLEQALEINRTLGNRSDQAWNLNMLANILMEQGDAPQAEALLAQALQIACSIGDRACEAWNRCTLGNVAFQRGDWARAKTEYALALEISRRIGDAAGEAAARRYLSNALREQGDYKQSYALGIGALRIFQELGMRGDLPESFESMAALFAVQGHPDRAVRLQGAAAAQRMALGAIPPPGARAALDRAVASLSEALGEAAFADAWEQGRALTLEQAFELAQTDPSQEIG